MQLRRQNRLRREYLYKKEQDAKDAATLSRKQITRDAKDVAIRVAKGKGVAGKQDQATSAGEFGFSPYAMPITAFLSYGIKRILIL